MANASDDQTQEILLLIRSYIRRGSVKKFKLDPGRNEAVPSDHPRADIPGELLAVLARSQNDDDGISQEMIDLLRQYDRKIRQQEDDLTHEQKQQLAVLYHKLKKAKNSREVKEAEAEISNLDKAVQDVFAAQKRLRQSLASHVYHDWQEQNSQDESDDGDESDDAYQDEADMSQGSESGDDDEASEDSDQDGDGQDGDGQSEGQDAYSEQGTRAEDSQKGLEKWLRELEEQIEEAEQKAEEEAEDDNAEGEAHGPDPARKGDPSYDLSTESVNPRHLRIVRQAFEKLLRRGRNKPTALPRWDKRQFVKRMLTSRPLRPAKQPTLERQAVMFIIDNSGSMSSLENAARAFAAALSQASGPTGSDVIVATSFNGNFINTDSNQKPQSECWFLNGTYMGFLPEPSAATLVDKKNQGQCWEWFIRKELRRHGVNVKMLGIYGDNNGAHIWCYLSNGLKEVPCLWFNPCDAEGRDTTGPVMLEKNPYIAERSGVLPAKTYSKGDYRHEKFRGLSFLHVMSADDIVMTLKRHIRN